MSYTPSFMHIISAERRIANECQPDPMQSVSHHATYVERERSTYALPLKTPILKINIETLEIVQTIRYTRELAPESVSRIAAGSNRGFISEGFYWTREATWEAMAINTRRAAITLLQHNTEYRKAKRVTAISLKDGEMIIKDSQAEMADYLGIYASRLACAIKKGDNVVNHEVFYTDYPRVERKTIQARVKEMNDKVHASCKPVMLVDNNTKEQHSFESIGMAASFIGCMGSYVSSCCNKGHMCHGYSAHYIVDGKPMIIKRQRSVRTCNKDRLNGCIIDNGQESKEFSDVYQASAYLQTNVKNVYNALHRKHKCNGYTVKYIDKAQNK